LYFTKKINLQNILILKTKQYLLLLLMLADPKNISKTLPIFSSKQLFAQLILSGGLFTVLAP